MPYTLPDYLNIDKDTIDGDQLEVYEEAYPYTKYFEIFNYRERKQGIEYGEDACWELDYDLSMQWSSTKTKTFY